MSEAPNVESEAGLLLKTVKDLNLGYLTGEDPISSVICGSALSLLVCLFPHLALHAMLNGFVAS